MRFSRIFLILAGASFLFGCVTEGGFEEKPVSIRDAAIANVRMGNSYLNDGRVDLARAKLLRAVELDPSLPEAHTGLGLLYWRTGENQKADQHFREALDLDPSSAESQNYYGVFLCVNGEFKKGERYLLKAANNSRYRTPWVALTNAGNCARRDSEAAMAAGDHERAGTRLAVAETNYRKAVQYNPRYSESLLQLARLRFNAGNYLGARGFLQRYNETTRPTADALLLCVRIERELGDRQTENICASDLRNLHPNSSEAQQLLQILAGEVDGERT